MTTSTNAKCDSLSAILALIDSDDRFESSSRDLCDMIDHPRDFDHFDDFSCGIIIDLIFDHADDITAPLRAAIESYALLIDPTQSDHAAHIRDTFRDNCD
jgi:hypothetical protein